MENETDERERRKKIRKTLMIKSKIQLCPFILPFSKNKNMGIYVKNKRRTLIK